MLRRGSVARLALAALLGLAPARSPGAAPSPRARLSVAAAANLKGAIEELARTFEAREPGVQVAVTLGASGAFFAQIRNGAPFDVFFSADRDYPRRLLDERLGGPHGEVVYARGRLAIWLPPGSPPELAGGGIAALVHPAIRRIAIPNPSVAPYGRAAVAALEAAGIHAAVAARLVLGQSASQAAHFAKSGAADAAIIPLSIALSPELADGTAHAVPDGSHPPIEQSALVLAGAREPALAEAFLRHVTAPHGREVLTRHGYSPP